MARFIILLCAIAAASALPAQDQVITRLVPDGPRFMYAEGEDGQSQLVDSWIKVSDLARMARYNPEQSNQYHLFTRSNPTVSQPLVIGNNLILQQSNFNPQRRTVVLIHGFLGSATAGSNAALVPAYLQGEDVNVIVFDWSAGSHWGPNGSLAGRAAALFFNWLNQMTGATASQYHIIGFSVGGHMAGIVARFMNGNVAYVTALDPASRWELDDLVGPNDSLYTEVIHTSAGVSGWGDPLGHTDFYPNGGRVMPGCLLNVICDHQRSYEYMAESVATAGFTNSIECRNRAEASIGACTLTRRLHMGGRIPKTGATGLYFLTTNRSRPFSIA
ncbi:pancreatic triacylglycerol lipase-like [Ostrinia nubilalis]|uniref:pancreatic triacylglycerol lipase-like n=1 Tax=Ostrinia nubilalis TaxID=29057 RepID=UPI0030823233